MVHFKCSDIKLGGGLLSSKVFLFKRPFLLNFFSSVIYANLDANPYYSDCVYANLAVNFAVRSFITSALLNLKRCSLPQIVLVSLE